MNISRFIQRKRNGKAKRKAVYTFIFGDYDDLKSPAIITPGWDHICFTDDPTLRSDVWDVRLSRRRRSDRQLEPKKYATKHKILFHRYLQGYDLSLSIDASLELNCNLDDLMREHFRAGDDMMICYQARDCIYDDAELSKQRLLDEPARIDVQMQRYRAAGYPAHHGLHMSGIIARRHGRANVSQMCELWWREHRRRSKRDQLSLNYAIWKSAPIKISALDYGQQFFERRNFIGYRHKRSINFGVLDINFETEYPTAHPCPDKDYVGVVDTANCDRIFGWAADRKRLNTSINVGLYDGGRLIATAPANLMRVDVGAYLGDNGLHGFAIPIPASLRNGAGHSISIRFEHSEMRLSVQHQQIESLLALGAERQREDDSLTTELANQRQKVLALIEQVLERQSAVDSLTIQLTEQREKVVALDERVAERQAAVESLATQLVERHERVLKLVEHVGERQSAVDSLVAELGESQNKVTALTAQVAAQEAELRKIRSTLGWRLLRQYGKIKYSYLLPIYRRLNLDSSRLSAKISQSLELERFDETPPFESTQVAGWDPIGKWEPRYEAVAQCEDGHAKYGNVASYQLAALFLADCKEVEDWGCGFGTFKRYCLSPRYFGIDGSASRRTDSVADLREHVSQVDGILLRHVLEHNSDWRQILLNAIKSFSKRMVLVIYTPFGDVTRNIRKQIPQDTKVPLAISFRKEDITSCIAPTISWFTIVGEPLAEYETMFFLQKDSKRCASDAARQEVSYFPDFDGDL